MEVMEVKDVEAVAARKELLRTPLSGCETELTAQWEQVLSWAKEIIETNPGRDNVDHPINT